MTITETTPDTTTKTTDAEKPIRCDFMTVREFFRGRIAIPIEKPCGKIAKFYVVNHQTPKCKEVEGFICQDCLEHNLKEACARCGVPMIVHYHAI